MDQGNVSRPHISAMILRKLAGFCLVGVALSAPACSRAEVDDAALAAIERSRTTDATYSVFAWNRIARSGIEEWSAEFHSGDLHRVETPRDRLIANCALGTGTHLNLVTGEDVSSPAVAGAACGVQSNAQILSARLDGRTSGPFGIVEHITIRDPEHVRRYQIAANGAIVGATIEEEDGTVLLEMRAVALHDAVPGDIFSEESLAGSEVPEEFRSPPPK